MPVSFQSSTWQLDDLGNDRPDNRHVLEDRDRGGDEESTVFEKTEGVTQKKTECYNNEVECGSDVESESFVDKADENLKISSNEMNVETEIIMSDEKTATPCLDGSLESKEKADVQDDDDDKDVVNSDRLKGTLSSAISSSTSQEILHETLADLQNEEAKVTKTLSNAVRDTATMTEEMKTEVIELLETFQLPYIIAPFEAEAQCAVLEEVNLELCFLFYDEISIFVL